MKRRATHKRGKLKYYAVIHKNQITGTIIETNKRKALAKAKKTHTSPVRVIRYDPKTGSKIKTSVRGYR